MASLSAVFVTHLPESSLAAVAASPQLDERLALCIAEAREHWPGVDNKDDEAVRFFAERISPDRVHEADKALSKLATIPLFLICACVRGDTTALRLFRDSYQGSIERALYRFGDQAFVEELCQQLLTRLLVASNTKPPDIVKYHGRGQLEGWLQIAAIRQATNAVTRGPRERPAELDVLVDRAIVIDDPELAILKRQYRQHFKRAFELAFDKLESRGRNLLRHQYLDGLNLDQMALLYGVGRSTVARWRSQARGELFKHTRAIFSEQLNLSRGEFDSIMRLIDSQLDASLSRILRQ